MVLRSEERKTIELLNPWHLGEWRVELGVERAEYLRQIERVLSQRKQFLLLVGSRRVGKTWILWQLVRRLIVRGVEAKRILFLSLDNTNLQELKLYDLLSTGKYEYAILDEVHYCEDWAKILKSLYDLPGYKTRVVASGSSMKQIEDGMARLTGRETMIEVMPLSYGEFGQFDKEGGIEGYLRWGGYPEQVVEKVPNYLNELLRDVVEKDVVRAHRVANTQYLYDLMLLLAKQVGYFSSPTRMAKTLQLDNKTVANYLEYLREVRLVERVCQYSPSVKERLYAPKKYYFWDLGMRNSLVGMSDVGSLVENAVYLSLVRKFGAEQVSYLSDKSGHEVDFGVQVKRGEMWLVESKYLGSVESVVKRVNKLIWAKVYGQKVKRRVVVTDGVSETVERERKKLELVSLSEWLG